MKNEWNAYRKTKRFQLLFDSLAPDAIDALEALELIELHPWRKKVENDKCVAFATYQSQPVWLLFRRKVPFVGCFKMNEATARSIYESKNIKELHEFSFERIEEFVGLTSLTYEERFLFRQTLCNFPAFEQTEELVRS